MSRVPLSVLTAAASTALLCAACSPAPAPTAVPAPPATFPATAPVPAVNGVSLRIADARTRATPAAGSNAAGFLRITNTGTADDTLLGGSAVGVGTVEIHQTSNEGGVMQMRALPEGLAIPAGKTVELAPNGTHLMLLGVQRALVAGETIGVELHFAKAGTVRIALHVDALDAAP